MKTTHNMIARRMAPALAGLVFCGLAVNASAAPRRTAGAHASAYRHVAVGFDHRQERALVRQLASVEGDSRRAASALAGFSDGVASQYTAQARRNLSDARIHIRNASYRGAGVALDRAATASALASARATELHRIKANVSVRMANVSRRLGDVRIDVSASQCGIADGFALQAEADLRAARRSARHGDWISARSAVQRASNHVADANRAAVAGIERRRTARAFDRRLATLDRNLDKAQRNIARQTHHVAPRRALDQARNQRANAVALARRAEYSRANAMLDRAEATARAAVASVAARTRPTRRAARTARNDGPRGRTWVFSSL